MCSITSTTGLFTHHIIKKDQTVYKIDMLIIVSAWTYQPRKSERIQSTLASNSMLVLRCFKNVAVVVH